MSATCNLYVEDRENGSFNNVYTANNQLFGYNYDAAGNLLSTGSAYNLVSMTYDAENRISSANGTVYVYDAEGNRVQKQGVALTETVYFGGRPITRFDGGWTDLIYGPTGLIAEVPGMENADPVFHLTDHLGTQVGSVNGSGILTNPLDYTPWGQIFSGSTSDPYFFTGKERDQESGLDYFGARYYASNMGRFSSPDPLGGHLENPQSLNKYAYALNNPLTNTDPTGLDSYLQCTPTKDNTSTCQSQQVGGTEKNPQMANVQGVTGANGFTATRIGNNPDGSGGLVDLSTGTGSYTASVNGSGVQFSNDGGQSSSSGVYVNGTPNNTFQDAGFANGGALSGFKFTLTNSKMEANQAEAGTFSFSGTPEQAGAALQKAGFSNVPGVNAGMDEYRSRGSFLTGSDAGHFNVNQILLSPRGSVPQASGNMHFGEHNPFSPLGWGIHIPFEASK